jgi:ArsR family transcriptional regulator
MNKTAEDRDGGGSPALRVLEDPATDRAVAMLRALAHPVRFRIMQLLADKERFGILDPTCCAADEVCVCRIHALFDLSGPAISHHLKLLRDAGLVDAKKSGIWVYYAVRPGALSLVNAAMAELEPVHPAAEDRA